MKLMLRFDTEPYTKIYIYILVSMQGSKELGLHFLFNGDLLRKLFVFCYKSKFVYYEMKADLIVLKKKPTKNLTLLNYFRLNGSQ